MIRPRLIRDGGGEGYRSDVCVVVIGCELVTPWLQVTQGQGHGAVGVSQGHVGHQVALRLIGASGD